jgi:hypothetical protein
MTSVNLNPTRASLCNTGIAIFLTRFMHTKFKTSEYLICEKGK